MLENLDFKMKSEVTALLLVLPARRSSSIDGNFEPPPYF
jgi:hypothetical protein